MLQGVPQQVSQKTLWRPAWFTRAQAALRQAKQDARAKAKGKGSGVREPAPDSDDGTH